RRQWPCHPHRSGAPGRTAEAHASPIVMREKQSRIGIGMASGLAVAILAWHFLPPVRVADDAIARLTFAGKCLLIPGFTLLIGIGAVANRRFFLPEAIDGSPDAASLDINLRYNRNTLEQTALVIIAWPLLALSLPAERVGMLAVLAVLFGIGRAAFWLGYL